MEEINLLYVCLNAFAAVMGLLFLLAVVMRLLNILFPAEKPSSDAALAAAISAAAQTVAPGSRVTRIEPQP